MTFADDERDLERDQERDQDRADPDPAEGDGQSLLPPHLSPSAASTYEQCPQRWRFRYVDRLPDPPGIPALAGTFAHRVLELLLQEAPERRTADTAKELARVAWPETEADPDYQALALTDAEAREFRWRGWLAIEGLWAVEDPAGVVVEATEHQVRTELGGVPFRGIVDRIDVDPSGGLVITDYKSGRAPTPRFSADRLRQVLLYAAAVAELTGRQPKRARLLYLGQKVVEVDVDSDNLGKAVGALGATWGSLSRSCDNDDFAPRPGPLCGWCPYVDRCAAGRAEVTLRHEAGVMRADAPALVALAAAS
ncbi:MAG: PD-(D/E)XK nuclease family protein [Acidimicrobiales bacterium]|nr:PD-(D/E)XK nuclease family protein [Acidimicrobiales bacterium]